MAFSRNLLGIGLATAATALVLSNPLGAQTIPNDAQPACPISPAQFNAMFESGTATLNGVVKPANSTVNLVPNCGFFVWSHQMFLWLTSPAPRRYGGGGRILFSPTFFTVSPESGGRRTFIRNNPELPFRMGLRMTELGPHLLPALVSRSGQVIEVQPTDPRKPVPPVVRLQNGRSVRLSDVRVAAGNRLQFFDTGGRQVQVRKLAPPPIKRVMVQMEDGRRVPVVSRAELQTPIQARKLVFHNIPIFIDPSNNVIDVEPGQADGGVLISQNGSLIFYIIAVNDVFAYHRTMQGAAVIPSNTAITFPLTMANANAVTAFAASKGFTIVDPEALAIETKSSWVEATSVPNPNDYIQATATIPTFDKSNPENWVPSGQKTVKMVMVGIHVVGSTLGHGEMVWGSFEHFGNTPNAAYSYNSTTGPKSVPQNTGGTWLFSPNGSVGPFNQMNASWDTTTGHLVSTSAGVAIAPTPILRQMPWGIQGTNAVVNTQVISGNAAVINQLLAGDVRRNYFQVGSTWTIGGAAPNGVNEVGTNQLANTTMETFAQGTNCFACHHTNKVAVSHVYRVMQPLP